MSPLLLFIPLLWALWRRFDAITITLGLGMALCIAAVWQAPEAQQHLGLGVTDSLIAVAMAYLIFHHVNKGRREWTDKARRAQVITIVACAKVTIWIAYHTGGIAEWNHAAAASNGLLLYQILVAGGVGHERICRAYHSFARSLRDRFFGREDRGTA